MNVTSLLSKSISCGCRQKKPQEIISTRSSSAMRLYYTRKHGIMQEIFRFFSIFVDYEHILCKQYYVNLGTAIKIWGGHLQSTPRFCVFCHKQAVVSPSQIAQRQVTFRYSFSHKKTGAGMPVPVRLWC